MAGITDLIPNGIIDKSGDEIISASEKFTGKIVGLYFSAHWCPPCRGFTPVLSSFYKNYSKEKNFEIIFISSDRDENSFQEYFTDMPWFALKYQERSIKDRLSQTFSVSGIPTLILLDGDSGEVICADGRGKIQYEDPEGLNFPWRS